MRVSGGPDERVAEVARLQRGRIARTQLRLLGLSDTMIAGRVASGRLHRLYRGVYAVGHRAPVPFEAETAALLAVPTAIALAGRSATAIWQIPTRHDQDHWPELIAHHASALPGLIVHRVREPLLDRIRFRVGLPVVSPAWTLLQLAATASPATLERAVDDVLVRRLASLAQLDALLTRATGHLGVAALRALLERETEPPLTRSEGERRLLELLRAAGLPAPLVNVRLHGFEVDFHWPEQRLVVELDGLAFHTTRRSFERDRRKDQVLRAAGCQPLRIAGGQLRRRPMEVVAVIAAALAAASSSER